MTAAEDAEVERLVDAMQANREQEAAAAARPGGWADRRADREADSDRWVNEVDHFNWARKGRQR